MTHLLVQNSCPSLELLPTPGVNFLTPDGILGGLRMFLQIFAPGKGLRRSGQHGRAFERLKELRRGYAC